LALVAFLLTERKESEVYRGKKMKHRLDILKSLC